MDRTETLPMDQPPSGPGESAPGLVVWFSEAPLPGDGAYPARPELTLGRSQDCFIFLEDSGLSRLHCVVRFGPGGATVQDQQSHNGTRVNGQPVTQAVPVKPGDVIRCGRTLLGVVDDIASFGGWRARGLRGPMVGGPAMTRVQQELAAFATVDLEVMVLGESGTGKELAAQQLHQLSGRTGAMTAVNCAELAESLFEAELFGARKGAYTGATASRPGLLAAAHRGTLFMDEVAELPLNLQAKLLRALEQREVRPLGGTETVKVDVRLVSATNRDLAQQVQVGSFREDLYHRLRGAVVRIPPLRQRPEDIPLLVEHINRGGPRPTAAFMEKLLQHSWPGNVRELDRVLREAAARARAAGDDRLSTTHLRQEVQQPTQSQEDPFEQVRQVLARHQGNVSRAATELGLHRAQVYSMLRDRGLSAADFR